MLTIPIRQARRFLFRRCGLLGKNPFRGREGVKQYVDRVGCVQYDPVDVCGQSHELAFFAHVDGMTKEVLHQLLYQERCLIDYFDKNMAIMSVSDWPYLTRTRESYRHTRSMAQIAPVRQDILRIAHAKGCVSSQELPYQDKVDWYWSPTSLSRAALEAMYFAGELVIHHKDRTIKSYSPAGDLLPKALLEAKPQNETKQDMQLWQLKRRIGAVGLLQNGASDAWLGIEDFKADNRGKAFDILEKRGDITPVKIEGQAKPCYLLTSELALLHECEKPFTGARRVRFLPPLDCMLWDRKLISRLFGFDYTWEIYTPQSKLKYAHYVLPVTYGEGFAGRVQLQCLRKERALRLVSFWPEEGFKISDAFQGALDKELYRLCAFHGLDTVQKAPNALDKP